MARLFTQLAQFSLGRVLNRLAEYAELVKWEHTIFALPFALSTMLLATPQAWPAWPTVGWIILCMVGGRTYAMAVNRLLDWQFDAKNPRTQNRGLPAGRVRGTEVIALSVVALGCLVLATLQLPLICQQLLPLAILILTVYSLMKRWHASAHLILGLALGCSAIGGWLAVTGQWAWLPVLFGLAITAWVAGFDLIYACQDITIDRELGLKSIPAAIGLDATLVWSRVCHGLTVLLLAGFGAWYPVVMGQSVGWGFWLGLSGMAALLVLEHWWVSRHQLDKINTAFFTLNGIVSVLFSACILAARVLGRA